MILANTIVGMMGQSISILAFLGSPIVALSIGTLIAIYGLMAKDPTKEVLHVMDDGSDYYSDRCTRTDR